MPREDVAALSRLGSVIASEGRAWGARAEARRREDERNAKELQQEEDDRRKIEESSLINRIVSDQFVAISSMTGSAVSLGANFTPEDAADHEQVLDEWLFKTLDDLQATHGDLTPENEAWLTDKLHSQRVIGSRAISNQRTIASVAKAKSIQVESLTNPIATLTTSASIEKLGLVLLGQEAVLETMGDVYTLGDGSRATLFPDQQIEKHREEAFTEAITTTLSSLINEGKYEEAARLLAFQAEVPPEEGVVFGDKIAEILGIDQLNRFKKSLSDAVKGSISEDVKYGVRIVADSITGAEGASGFGTEALNKYLLTDLGKVYLSDVTPEQLSAIEAEAAKVDFGIAEYETSKLTGVNWNPTAEQRVVQDNLEPDFVTVRDEYIAKAIDKGLSGEDAKIFAISNVIKDLSDRPQGYLPRKQIKGLIEDLSNWDFGQFEGERREMVSALYNVIQKDPNSISKDDKRNLNILRHLTDNKDIELAKRLADRSETANPLRVEIELGNLSSMPNVEEFVNHRIKWEPNINTPFGKITITNFNTLAPREMINDIRLRAADYIRSGIEHRTALIQATEEIAMLQNGRWRHTEIGINRWIQSSIMSEQDIGEHARNFFLAQALINAGELEADDFTGAYDYITRHNALHGYREIGRIDSNGKRYYEIAKVDEDGRIVDLVKNKLTGTWVRFEVNEGYNNVRNGAQVRAMGDRDLSSGEKWVDVGLDLPLFGPDIGEDGFLEFLNEADSN